MLQKTPPDDVAIEVRELHSCIFTQSAVVHPVDGISFKVRRGETLGIVGESGSGKTMMSLSLLGLLPRPGGRIVSGQIIIDGEDIAQKTDREMRDIRGHKITMILQDPQTSLNPVFTVGNQVREAVHQSGGARSTSQARSIELLKQVNIAAPEQRLKDYPHQMSGGMKQRVVGAISIAGEPSVIVADEPTTALDVTIQLQYLELLRELQRRTGTAIIFVTHDFGVVARMCDSVAVMYAGRIVEQGPVREIFDNPQHPYTEALLAAVPDVEKRVDRLQSIEGQPPMLSNMPEGCRFAPRCRYAQERCRRAYPDTYATGPDHVVNCWRLDPSWTQP